MSCHIQNARESLTEIRHLINGVALSAAILGHAPFEGRRAASRLAQSLQTALLEFEIALAEDGLHSFEVKS
jgi:hypothetical protein